MNYILKDGSQVESKPIGRCKIQIGDKSPDGFLTICDRGPDIERPSKNYPAVICLCQCGNYTLISIQSFKKGSTKSCGCYNREQAAQRCKIIGKLSTPRKDYTNINNPFYTFIERTKEKTNVGYKWLIQCKKCNKQYIEVPSQLISAERARGNNPCSCWKKQSQGSNKIEELLIANNISYVKEKTFIDCLSPKGNTLKFDFYINNQYLLEYDGEQHFIPTSFNSQQDKDNKFILQKEYDQIKNAYCLKNHIPLIRIPYTYYKNITINDLLLNSQFLIKEENNE